MQLFDFLAGFTRVIIGPNERALLIEKGQIRKILTPGRHRVRRKDTEVEIHDLQFPVLNSGYAEALLRDHVELAGRHVTVVATKASEVAIATREGRIARVMTPDSKELLWSDAGPWQIERVMIDTDPQVPAALAKRLIAAGFAGHLKTVAVADGFVGMLSFDGVFQRQLAPGHYSFWSHGRSITARQVDMRWRSHEATGQEILTKDRVTLRVNLVAQYRVTDPERAVAAVSNFVETLHLALQMAFRKTLGAMTLDALLQNKVSVDAEAAEKVRREMEGIGVEVGEISLKDVILPGEMRDILNQVVAAEKAAEANVIRRREETNATRSLLNTAKVMAENPVMLRLKELEALESIAGKVERLTVHNGTEGLMSDLVKLRD
ncbi:slipin family protein [Pseudaestuariivita rosea]|uniref:slipin family protein n=1 Tax=Pseudaestuariivita rosea TaxID=2763263 RepID=UPI001F288E5D|nr:slipin family protein [Pseudaestuariivita rosea]